MVLAAARLTIAHHLSFSVQRGASSLSSEGQLRKKDADARTLPQILYAVLHTEHELTTTINESSIINTRILGAIGETESESERASASEREREREDPRVTK